MNPFKAIADSIFEWVDSRKKARELDSPVTTYSETGSPYIQAKIAMTPWENHEYIDQLIRMQREIILHSQGIRALHWFEANSYYAMTKRLAEDYAALQEEYYQQWAESNPKAFARYIRKQEETALRAEQRRTKEEAFADELRRAKAEKTRADWEAAKQQTPASPS